MEPMNLGPMARVTEGLFTGSMYVPADDIADVTDDEIRLVVVVE